MLTLARLEHRVQRGEVAWRTLDEAGASDLAQALSDLTEAGGLGHPGALYEHGILIEEGIKVKKDLRACFDLYMVWCGNWRDQLKDGTR